MSKLALPRRFGGPNGYGHKGWALAPHPSPLSLDHETLWWRRVLPVAVRTPVVHLLRRLGASNDPTPVDFRPQVVAAGGPGIFDQLSSSSCTGHAEVGSTMLSLLLKGTPAPERLSPFDAYFKGRFIDAPDAPLVDDGAVPESVTRACAEWGICSFAQRPTDVAKVNERPALDEIEKGLHYRVRGIYGLVPGADLGAQVRATLSAGFPIKLGVIVDVAFENWAGGDPIGAPDPNQLLGGHAIYLVGWARAAGGFEYYIANSWGVGAGESGFFRVNDDWLNSASDFETADVVLETA